MDLLKKAILVLVWPVNIGLTVAPGAGSPKRSYLGYLGMENGPAFVDGKML